MESNAPDLPFCGYTIAEAIERGFAIELEQRFYAVDRKGVPYILNTEWKSYIFSNLTPAGLAWLAQNPDAVNACGAGEAHVWAVRDESITVKNERTGIYSTLAAYKRIDRPVSGKEGA